jgi:hypothetical protein
LRLQRRHESLLHNLKAAAVKNRRIKQNKNI